MILIWFLFVFKLDENVNPFAPRSIFLAAGIFNRYSHHIQNFVLIILYWNIVHVQCCVSFWCIAKWLSWFSWYIHICIYIYIHFYILFHYDLFQFSVQFSHPVMSDSLRPYGQQHARLPCPPSTPRAYSNSYPSSRWCHPPISSSVIPSFPAFSLSQSHIHTWLLENHSFDYTE